MEKTPTLFYFESDIRGSLTVLSTRQEMASCFKPEHEQVMYLNLIKHRFKAAINS